MVLIEDRSDILRLLTDSLEKSGLTVLIATTVMDASALLRRITPDAVVVAEAFADDGESPWNWVRATHRKVPILVLTDRADGCRAAVGAEADTSPIVACDPRETSGLLANLRFALARNIASGSEGRADDVDLHGLVWIKSDGRLVWAANKARQILITRDIRWLPQSEPPVELRDALRISDGARTLPVSAELERQKGIRLSLVSRFSSGDVLIHVDDVDERAQADALVDQLSFSRCEAVAVIWLSRGLSVGALAPLFGLNATDIHNLMNSASAKVGARSSMDLIQSVWPVIRNNAN